jgi:hypothetical protein
MRERPPHLPTSQIRGCSMIPKRHETASRRSLLLRELRVATTERFSPGRSNCGAMA